MPIIVTPVTASDHVFHGMPDGWFRAVDARSGAGRWRQRVGSAVIAQPITYKVPTGGNMLPWNPGIGGVAVTNSHKPGFPARGNTLYVFSVGGESLEAGPGLKTNEASAPAIILELAHPQLGGHDASQAIRLWSGRDRGDRGAVRLVG